MARLFQNHTCKLFIIIAAFTPFRARSRMEVKMDNEDIFCQPFLCPKQWFPVPKSDVQIKSAGCRNLSGAHFMVFKRDQDDMMSPCCDQLSTCYQTCGTVQSICKDKFLKCMENVCDDVEVEKKKDCQENLTEKKMHSQFNQCNSFEKGQKLNCRCVEKDKVYKSRKEVLQNFYKKHNPDVEIDKIDALLEKADTPGKFASLMQKVIAKYPQSIERMKDKQYLNIEKQLDKAEKEGKLEEMLKKFDIPLSDDDPVDPRDEL